jgi:hypothetical protein
MKPIDQMTLTEIADFFDDEGMSLWADRLRAIHELTRWIPVSERMPTEEDVDEDGEVLAWSPDPHITYTASCIPLSYHFTHWQRITPPEGV